MRISYVLPLEMNSYSGVLQKVRQQVSEWEKQGHQVTCFYISSKPLGRSIDLNSNETLIHLNFLRRYNFPRILARSIGLVFLKRILKYSKPDILYYRYVLWFPGISTFLKGYNTIIEMNSHDINEFESKGFFFKVSYKKLRKLVLKSTSATISVSENIRDSMEGYVDKNYLIPNGFSFDNSVPKKLKNRPNKIVFISTPGQYWQGLDIIVSLMSRLTNYTLDVVGWTKNDFAKKYPDVIIGTNIIFHGYKLKDDFNKIMRDCGYAFNAFAMHRKGMTHNSALKTAEYLNNNLAIISGYIETGLNTDAILSVESYNSVHSYIHKIEDFLERWKTKDINLDKIIEQIGIEQTERKRLEVFNKSLESHAEEY
ncbi:glycosyltransferase [Enterobacter hormaechei]|uniref:glycosyltransferase n=1 Tax=Enterobacter hormaechei TaxID=158836 RepID=UPI0020B8BA7C|nr:glycosyltransferase [Enterobacter hormaechei]MCP3813339.1 glycosyltransferase [Enterobacter hormaechei]MCP3824958.1 glycosyltransferase [Enterobacter hormaechei]MCW4623650.1 glycosyltransferase [Enterobacter hormaechei]